MTPQELEEISFRNLVDFNKDSLTKIINGELATNVFTEQCHRRLIKYGVIRRVPNRKYTKPTPRAMKVLKELELEGSE